MYTSKAPQKNTLSVTSKTFPIVKAKILVLNHFQKSLHPQKFEKWPCLKMTRFDISIIGTKNVLIFSIIYYAKETQSSLLVFARKKYYPFFIYYASKIAKIGRQGALKSPKLSKMTIFK